MTTAITERIDIDEIDRRAREVKFGRVLLTVISMVWYVLGFCLGRLWLGVVWSALAFKVGLDEGRKAGMTRGPGRPG